MDPSQLRFAIASRRFYRVAEFVHRFVPKAFQLRISRLTGRLFSPYRPDRPNNLLAFRLGLGQNLQQASETWRHWLSSHGLFAVNIFDYEKYDGDWLKSRVTVEDPGLLGDIVRRGGMLLTYHSFHHNTLGIVMGLSGARVYGVAATEKNSPFAPYTGRYVRIINGQSEAKFGGGRYLFTDDMRTLARECREALAQGHVVVSLCDNPAPANGEPPCRFFDRSFHVGTGIVDMAVQSASPIYFAIFFPDLAGGFRLRLARGPQATDTHTVTQAYFSFLEEAVRHAPWCWQGWFWYSNLPPAGGDLALDQKIKALMLESIALNDSRALGVSRFLRRAASCFRKA